MEEKAPPRRAPMARAGTGGQSDGGRSLPGGRVSVLAAPTARRDVRIIGLVAVAHAFSHFFQLALPPLFPLLRAEFGVGYVALGAVMSLFYAVSAIGQTTAGFLVDR